MRKISALIVASVFGLAASAAFAADEAKKDPAAGDATFKKLDADKDGAISKAEAETMKGLNEIFDVADENKDGKLDVAEFGKASGTIPKN